MPGPNPYQYQYKPDDDPLTVSDQFGVTPQQLIQANPGGYPFSTGQNINIPMLPPLTQANINMRGRGQGSTGPYTYYNAPAGAQQPPSLLEQRMNQPVNYGYDVSQRGRDAGQVDINDMRGRGYGQPTSVDQINAMRGRGTGVTNNGAMSADYWVAPTIDPTKPYGGFTNDDPSNTDYAKTKAAQYYAAAGTPFLQQQRWDPQRKKYVSIGKLLKQGKLDLQGNWHRRSNRQRRNDAAARKNQKDQQAQDNTLTNSLINFSTSAG